MLSFSHALLKRHEVRAPSYTSYPGLDQFKQAFGPRHYAQALEHRRQSEYKNTQQTLRSMGLMRITSGQMHARFENRPTKTQW